MTVLPRVMFDTNDGNEMNGYWLCFDQSKIDLAAIGAALKEGLHVTIYMPNELEMEAVLQFDLSLGFWLGYPVPGTTRYLDQAARPPKL